MKTENIQAQDKKDSFAVIYQLVKSHKATRGVRRVKPYRGRRSFKARLKDNSCVFVTDFFNNGTLRVVKEEDTNRAPMVSTCNDLYITQIADLLNRSVTACARKRRVKRRSVKSIGSGQKSKRLQRA
jgi:hypothetical protein